MSDDYRHDQQTNGAHEREMRLERLDSAILKMQKDIARIDIATAVLKHSVDGDGVPGLIDHIKEVVTEMAAVKADLILRIAEVQKNIKEELSPLKIAVAAFANARGKRAASTLTWAARIIGSVVIVAMLSLAIYGIIHWLEGVPTIGNAIPGIKP